MLRLARTVTAMMERMFSWRFSYQSNPEVVRENYPINVNLSIDNNQSNSVIPSIDFVRDQEMLNWLIYQWTRREVHIARRDQLKAKGKRLARGRTQSSKYLYFC